MIYNVVFLDLRKAFDTVDHEFVSIETNNVTYLPRGVSIKSKI